MYDMIIDFHVSGFQKVHTHGQFGSSAYLVEIWKLLEACEIFSDAIQTKCVPAFNIQINWKMSFNNFNKEEALTSWNTYSAWILMQWLNQIM